MVKMEQWDKIRRIYHIEGKSIRQIARETGYARETVAKLAEQQDPPKYKCEKEYATPVLRQFKERLREILRENQKLSRKQRWTTPRMFEQLVAEGYQGAESTVRHYVGQIRKAEKIPNSYIRYCMTPATMRKSIGAKRSSSLGFTSTCGLDSGVYFNTWISSFQTRATI